MNLIPLIASIMSLAMTAPRNSETDAVSLSSSSLSQIDFGPEAKPDQSLFDLALSGYNRLQHEGAIKKPLLAVVDFTKPSSEKRMWVIDLEEKRLLYYTLVAHGRNSGELYATRFSNVMNSNQSSLGFYVTGSTYFGKNGLSLKLQGMEPGVNDKAESRAVVMHSAPYVSEKFIQQNGRLGRSFGCPAIPVENHKEVIEVLSEGTCLFLYYDDAKYLNGSRFLN